ncbi:MAG: nicotinate-nucleotide adenylyltransferase [Coriobacteriales bacterium]|nr:nicotinate-nucleotide adenylyltransferase [Coriobacteriales bacterium]
MPLSMRFDPLVARAEPDLPFRLGLFGGTFDPVHRGHLHIAACACEQFSLDGVLFMPAGRPVGKAGPVRASAKDRLAMLRAAVAGEAHFDVSSLELEREGPTYTVDTLRAVRARYGARVRLFLIVGLDVAAELDTWRDAPEIADAVTVLSAKRAITADLERRLRHNGRCFDIRPIESKLIDVSSSGLRASVGRGCSIRHLVPDAVHAYIREQGLYQG